MADRPLVAVAIGDPSGIGPEIVVKAFSQTGLLRTVRPLVIGDPAVLEEAARTAGVSDSWRPISVSEAGSAGDVAGAVFLLPRIVADRRAFSPGVPSAASGRAASEWLREAVGLALAGVAGAVVSAPVSKEALALAGYVGGQTELIARWTKTRDYTTMVVAGPFRVLQVTTHVSLRRALDLLTVQRVLLNIKFAVRACRSMRIAQPVIAVAGLNPHAGEGGLFGSEEQEIITPAIREARALGIRVVGPIPADVIFLHGLQGRYDAIITLFHDQGNIPIKLLYPRTCVSVNIGFPFWRVTTAHGTAYDIAGKGVANGENMKAALRLAATLASTPPLSESTI